MNMIVKTIKQIRPGVQVSFLNCCNHYCSSAGGLKVLFFGTDLFSVSSLDALHQMKIQSNNIADLSIVCGQESIIKKNKIIIPPTLKYAQCHELPYMTWSMVKSTRKFDNQYDLAVVSSFGHLIPKSILSQFPRGIINVHPSLLPRWRGAAPIIHTILAGDKETGISVIEISPNKFDEGKILLQQKMKHSRPYFDTTGQVSFDILSNWAEKQKKGDIIPKNCTSDKLLQLLGTLSAKMIPEVIKNIDMLRKDAHYQDNTLVTYARKVSKTSGVIDFKAYSCDYVERLQRALPDKIGLRSYWQGKQIKFGDIINKQEQHVSIESIGDCQYHKDEKLVSIQLKDGLLFFRNIQVGSKPMISAVSFYNGYMVDKNKKGVVIHVKFES